MGLFFNIIIFDFSVTPEPLDTDLMSREFSMQFGQIALTVGEKLVFQFTDAKGKIVTLSLGIKSIEGIDLNAVAAEKKSQSMPVSFITNSCGKLW